MCHYILDGKFDRYIEMIPPIQYACKTGTHPGPRPKGRTDSPSHYISKDKAKL
jgi:hypothetical protein